MHIRILKYLCCIVFAFLCLGGMWLQEKRLYEVHTESLLSTCTKEALAPLCIIEDIDHQPMEKITAALPSITPPEFGTQKQFSNDWISLVLFPHIEYSIVQRCVFGGLNHPYCDAQQREKVHSFVQEQLSLMLQSSNEDTQYRAMLLACARNRIKRPLPSFGQDTKMQAMSLYISLCTKTEEEKLERIKTSLSQKEMHIAMLLLSLQSTKESDRTSISTKIQPQTPFEKVLYQYLYSERQE